MKLRLSPAFINPYLNLMNFKSAIAIITLATAIISPARVHGDDGRFLTHFADSTLRLDYIFGGDSASTVVMLGNMSKTPGWAGRRHNLKSLPLMGNGQLAVTDAATGDTLYVTSFSTLFQEWIATPESSERARAFENTFLVPMPRCFVAEFLQHSILLDMYDNVRFWIDRFEIGEEVYHIGNCI